MKVNKELTQERIQNNEIENKLNNYMKIENENIKIRTKLLEEIELKKNEIINLKSDFEKNNLLINELNNENKQLNTILNDARAEHNRNSEEHSASMNSMRTLVKVLN